MEVTTGGEMWWSPRDPAQAALWGSWIELGEKFFQAIIAAPVPLDMRALKALKRSPLALDLYAWLTYEAYRAHKNGKGRFVAWKLLSEQMGGDYANVDEFARKARVALRKIATLYPDLKLGELRGGIRIEPDSLPAITPRSAAVTVEHSPAPITPPQHEPPTPPTTAPKDVTTLDRLMELARQQLAAYAASDGSQIPKIIILHNHSGGRELMDELRRALDEEAKLPC